jgi:hypothetical protein
VLILKRYLCMLSALRFGIKINRPTLLHAEDAPNWQGFVRAKLHKQTLPNGQRLLVATVSTVADACRLMPRADVVLTDGTLGWPPNNGQQIINQARVIGKPVATLSGDPSALRGANASFDKEHGVSAAIAWVQQQFPTV